MSKVLSIKPEFQLVQATVGRRALSNGYVYPAGTVFGRFYIPAGCTMTGNLKGVILYDSKGKNISNHCYKKSRVIEFVGTPAEYARCVREYAPSNIYLNKKRTQDLIERLLGIQVAAARATSPAKSPATPATKKPATKRVSPQQVNVARLQMRSKNMVDAWSTKPATTQPFSGNAYSDDSPWSSEEPITPVASVVKEDDYASELIYAMWYLIKEGRRAVAVLESLSTQPAPAPQPVATQDETDRLLEVFGKMIPYSFTRKFMTTIQFNYGLMASGQQKADYRMSLIRCLVSATRQNKITPEQVSAYIKTVR